MFPLNHHSAIEGAPLQTGNQQGCSYSSILASFYRTLGRKNLRVDPQDLIRFALRRLLFAMFVMFFQGKPRP